MLELLDYLIKGIQPFLVPVCFVSAWALVLLLAWSLWSAARDGAKTAKQMHQIPCPGCQFFTNDYRLKCTIHPSIANTEEAISCIDYTAKTNSMFY